MVTQQRLTRASTDKVIAGVCGGLAHSFNIEPVIVRLVRVALVVAGGISIFIYPLLWLVMPTDATQQYTMGQGWQEMQQQAQAFGQQATEQVQSVFNTPRYDPQTGQPIAAQAARRNRTLGLVLLGIGVLMLASMFPHGMQFAVALLVLGGGFYLFRRTS